MRFTFTEMFAQKGTSMHKKPYLEEKICCVCQRPFAWRKKWRLVWDEVKYCSQACRRQRQGGRHNQTPSADQ